MVTVKIVKSWKLIFFDHFSSIWKILFSISRPGTLPPPCILYRYCINIHQWIKKHVVIVHTSSHEIQYYATRNKYFMYFYFRTYWIIYGISFHAHIGPFVNIKWKHIFRKILVYLMLQKGRRLVCTFKAFWTNMQQY